MNGKGIWRQSIHRLWCNNYINLLEHDRIFCKWRTKSLVAKKIKNKIIISEQILEFKTSKILFWHEYYQEGKIHRSALPMTEILDFLNKDNLESKLSSIIGGHFGTMIAIFDFFHISYLSCLKRYKAENFKPNLHIYSHIYYLNQLNCFRFFQ